MYICIYAPYSQSPDTAGSLSHLVFDAVSSEQLGPLHFAIHYLRPLVTNTDTVLGAFGRETAAGAGTSHRWR